MADTPTGTTRTRRPLWLAALAALVTFAAVYGVWNQQQSKQEALEAPSAPGGLFLATQAAGTPLTAAGRITGLEQPCTGWLLDVGAKPQEPAIAVTAGRCMGIEDGATVLAGEAAPAGATLALNDFARVSSSADLTDVRVPIESILWASRRWTDIAILRLDSTYGDLRTAGVMPISTKGLPSPGDELLMATVPVAGVPDDQKHLRGSRCTAGAATDLAEGGLLSRGAVPTGCDGILLGSLGAPAFNQAGQAVGLVTATTIAAPDGGECAQGRPCEVRDGVVQAIAPETTYVVSVEGLGSCIRAGEITLTPDCPLEDPATVVPARTPQASAPAGSDVELVVESPSADPVGLRSGRLGEVDCFDDRGWQPASGSATVTMPTTPGWALACVGTPEHPTPVLVEAMPVP